MRAETLLIDIGPLHGDSCDCVLEDMHKAMSEPGGEDIWLPHDSVFIRELIESATRAGLDRFSALQTELNHMLHRSKFGPPSPRPVMDGGMVRWSGNMLDAAKLYLEGLPEAAWSASDYVLLVDYLVQKYLPHDFAMTQADWIAKRSMMMGKTQSIVHDISPETAATMLSIFADQKALEAAMRVANLNHAILEYGSARIADSIVALTDKTRHAMKRVILEYEKSKMLGEPMKNSSLQQALMDEFADLNRDWRRIALTEAGEMANQGFVSNIAPGEKIKRLEQYANACQFCKKWDGKVLTVVSPDKKDKDWQTEVWAGKTNVGRSASPYKRVGGQLVKRLDAEMWAPAAGTFHPHCRGQWLPLGAAAQADEFSLWLDGFVAANTKPTETS